MGDFPYRANNILECEFYLLENMDCCLVVFQPYRPLVQYCQDMSVEETVLPLAWRIVNDSLRTDVSLMYPPYQIALSCIHMACVILSKDCKQWFAELHVDLDTIKEISKQILNLYELWKVFDEKKEMNGILFKMPKPYLQQHQEEQPIQMQQQVVQQQVVQQQVVQQPSIDQSFYVQVDRREINAPNDSSQESILGHNFEQDLLILEKIAKKNLKITLKTYFNSYLKVDEMNFGNLSE